MPRWLLLVPVLLLLAPAARAETGEAKEFKDKNFRWTLPSKDWAFFEVPAGEKGSGYVIGAECKEDGGIRAHARVVDKGPSPEEIADEVRGTMAAGLKKVDRSAVGRGRLAGLDGSLVVLQGTAASGGTLWFRAYSVNVGSTLYQVLIEAYNGAESKRGEELDALRRGFRLLKGGGPVEADSGPSVHDEEPPPAGEPNAPTDWPADGPKLEGRKVSFPSHNLVWTLPENTPFTWREVKPEKTTEGLLVALQAAAPRKAPAEGEPQQNLCVVSFLVMPLHEGQTAEAIVNAPNVLASISKRHFDDNIDAGKTKITGDIEVGNVKGGRLMLGGAKGKEIHWFILQIVTLKSEQYEWHVEMLGGKEVQQEFGQALGALFKGIQFQDTKETVRGPLGVAAVSTHNGARGEDVDKEKEQTLPGITAKKPKGLANLQFHGEADSYMRLAWEGRGADGQTYFYFDVHGYDFASMQKEKKDLEDVIKQRETEWKTATTDAVTGKGKDPWFKASFGKAEGVGYRFTGTSGGWPFVEQGWVVKSKGNVLWIRAQFGGTNAEKSMESLFNAAKHGLKIP